MTSLGWIVGTWKSTNYQENQGEIWKASADGYLGRAWSVQAGDTIWSESMRILDKGDSLVLEVIHPQATSGEPVYFKELYTSSQKFTFEKRDYDWPHFISYWVEDDLMKAHVGSYEQHGGDLYFEWRKVQDL